MFAPPAALQTKEPKPDSNANCKTDAATEAAIHTSPLEQSPTPHTEEKLKDLFRLQAANAALQAENVSLRKENAEMQAAKIVSEDRERQHERALARASRRPSSSPVDLHDADLSQRCNALLASLGDVCDDDQTPFRITFGRTANALETVIQSHKMLVAVMRATEAAVTDFHALERSVRATLDDKQAAFEAHIREVSRMEGEAAKSREASPLGAAQSLAPNLLADLLSKYSAKMLMLEHYAGVQSRLLSSMQKGGERRGGDSADGQSSDEDGIESGDLEPDTPPPRAESPPAAFVATSSWGWYM
jgi:hypothetical protein